MQCGRWLTRRTFSHLHVRGVDDSCADAHLWQHGLNELPRAPVAVCGRDDVAPRRHQGEEHSGCRVHPRRCNETIHMVMLQPFHIGEALREVVHDAVAP